MNARFNQPKGLVLDNQGILYVADTENHVIRKISPEGEVTTLAGTASEGDADGVGKEARFRRPYCLSSDGLNRLFVLDRLAASETNPGPLQRIRQIDTQGTVVTLGLEPVGILNKFIYDIQYSAKLNGLYMIAGIDVYKVEKNKYISKITSSETFNPDNTGIYWGGRFDAPQPTYLSEVRVNSSDEIFVQDADRRAFWKITPDGQAIFFAGGMIYRDEDYEPDGCEKFAKFFALFGFAIDAQNNFYVADLNMLRKVTPDGCAKTLKIQEKEGDPPIPLAIRAYDLALDEAKNILYILSENKVYKLDLSARAPS